MLINDNSIEIYLAGPGFGEGALIIIGGTIVIGIDSCSTLIERPLDKPSFLEEKVNGIKGNLHFFWILTHFHSDHFQGFSSILNQFGDKLKHVFVPLDYTSADIAFNASAYEAKMSLDRDGAFYLARGEYKRIRNLLESEPLQHLYAGGPGKQVCLDRQLETRGGELLRLEVHVHGLQRRTLNDILGKEMPVALDNDEGRAKSRAVANQGSYIIHIKCGKFEGLFLGDAPCFRTEQVLSMREPYDAEIIFLKVAHHGSDDGTNRSLIERLCDAVPSIATRYAMITPFKHHKLPRIETIELLKEHSFQVRTSGAHDSEEIRNKIYKDFKFITNAAMSEATSPGGDIIAVRFANL